MLGTLWRSPAPPTHKIACDLDRSGTGAVMRYLGHRDGKDTPGHSELCQPPPQTEAQQPKRFLPSQLGTPRKRELNMASAHQL